jgi:hypothetical protein
VKWRAIIAATLALSACSESRQNLVSDPEVRSGSGNDSAAPRSDAGESHVVSAPDAAAESSIQVPTDASTAYCGKRACSCDDGLDNDADGLDDGLDPECTGAFDDDEATFATGTPWKPSACRDCYWDANSGRGDDSCRYPSECLSDPGFTGKGSCGSCEVSSECSSSCRARTPNGCDCFGCCEVATPRGVVSIQLVDDCTAARADDPALCPRCTLHETCRNDCGRCELCLGKTLADLPDDCSSYSCDDDLAVCGSSSPCPTGSYCHQGCCLVELR